MSFRKSIFLVLSMSALVALQACKTDFEINAPYDDIPVIFGALDQTVDTQYVKINKTYLGTGDNTTYAAINDSILFPNLSATIDEELNGDVLNSYSLEEKWVKNIEDGIFNTDSQKVYFFVPNGGLNTDATYKLTVNIDEGRKTAKAETKLVGNLDFGQLFKQQAHSGLSFASPNNSYSDVPVRWLSVEGASRYETSMVFYYDEHNQNGIEEKSIEWFLGASNSKTTDGGEDMTKEIRGDAFYKIIAGKLDGYENEDNVTKRVFKRIEFSLAAAGEDLSTYIGVNEPSNSIVSERPTFSNIDGGLGVFSSRVNIVMKEYQIGSPFQLSYSSRQELMNGQYTGHLKFQP
ncbi:MAG: hypothetical protein N4A35_09825 [Flavobacteriales bacterium]|jgi:hypothetical protein|nr:hypothetical protein [Flavobacteriales bacterium]